MNATSRYCSWHHRDASCFRCESRQPVEVVEYRFDAKPVRKLGTSYRNEAGIRVTQRCVCYRKRTSGISCTLCDEVPYHQADIWTIFQVANEHQFYMGKVRGKPGKMVGRAHSLKFPIRYPIVLSNGSRLHEWGELSHVYKPVEISLPKQISSPPKRWSKKKQRGKLGRLGVGKLDWPSIIRLKEQVFIRDSFECVNCGHTGSDANPLTLDYKLPPTKGGSMTVMNMQTMCRNCHEIKTGWPA